MAKGTTCSTLKNWRVVKVREVSFRVKGGGRRGQGRFKVGNTTDAVRLFRAVMVDDGREHFWAAYLDPQNGVVAVCEVGVGTVKEVMASASTVFGPALRLLGVNGVIVAHSHPSGHVDNESKEDRELTDRLLEAGKVVGVWLLDSLVIGMGREKKWRSLMWEEKE